MAGQDRPAVESVAAAPASAPERPPAQSRPPRRTWWKVAVLIFVAVLIVGLVPVALAGQLLGAWSLSQGGTPSPTAMPDLALPRAVWVATTVDVRAQPGGSSLATLEAGFPATLTAHRSYSGALWSRVEWAGPTPTSGGSGWVPDTSLVSYGGETRPIGDLGALAPSLRQALADDHKALAVALYFPDSGRLYHAQTGRSFVLGAGWRTALLVALFADAEARHVAPPASDDGSPAALLVQGDAATAAAVYKQLGDAPGVARALAAIGITAIQPAQGDWMGGTATAPALLQLYTALATGTILTAADRATVLGLLAHADASAAATLLAPGQPGPDGMLVLAQARDGGGWAASAAGIVAPTGGPRYVVVAAVLGQSSPDAAQAALRAFFQRLAPLLTH